MLSSAKAKPGNAMLRFAKALPGAAVLSSAKAKQINTLSGIGGHEHHSPAGKITHFFLHPITVKVDYVRRGRLIKAG